MKTELKNIKIAKRLLEQAMAALDNKFFLLSTNDEEITMEQAIAIMENYDVINELRNVIVNQYNKLDEQSKKNHELARVITDINKEWLSNYLFKINGMKGDENSQDKNPESYFNKMHRIKDLFERKIKTASEEELLKIRDMVEIGRKSGGDLYGQYQTISKLFATTYDLLLKKLPEHERKLTTSRSLHSTSLSKSVTEPTSPLSISSLVQSSHEQIDLKNKNLGREMLLFAFNKSNVMTRDLKERMEWIDYLFKVYSDKDYDEDLEEGIVFAINQLLDPIKSKNLSTLDKIHLLDKLVANNKKNGDAVIKAYKNANKHLTEELANQLIDEDRRLFQAINVEEYLKTGNKNESVKQMIHFYNNASQKFVDLILNENINMRILMIERLIHLAQICYEKGDYNAVMSILAALKTTAIIRMKNTMSGLSKEMKSVLEYLTIKLDSQPGNMANLRNEMDKFDGLVVPYVGNYLTDLEYWINSKSKARGENIFETDIGLFAATAMIAVKRKFEKYDLTILSTQQDFVNAINTPIYSTYEDYRNKTNYRSNIYEPKDKETNEIIEIKNSVDPNLKIKLFVPKAIKKTNKEVVLTQGATKLFFNENPELLIKFNELINKYDILKHTQYLEKAKGEIAEHNDYLKLFETLDRVFAEIDNYVDTILRSALSKPLDSMVISSISYIVEKKYAQLIAICDDDKLDEEKQAIKRILIDERTTFIKFIHELDDISKNYLENYEQNKVRKAVYLNKLSKLRKDAEKIESERKRYMAEIISAINSSADLDENQFIQISKICLDLLGDKINDKKTKEVKEWIMQNRLLEKLLEKLALFEMKHLNDKSQIYNLFSGLYKVLDDIQLDREDEYKDNFVLFKTAFDDFKKIEALSPELIIDSESTRLSTSSDQTNISTHSSELGQVAVLTTTPSSTMAPDVSATDVFEFRLPLNNFNEFLADIKLEEDSIKLEMEELSVAKEEQAQKIERQAGGIAQSEKSIELPPEIAQPIQENIEKYQKALINIKNNFEALQKIYRNQIEYIANLQKPLNEVQVMVIVCNLRALLTSDYERAIEILKHFDTGTLEKLSEKLHNFKDMPSSNVVPQLHDLAFQLNLFIDYASGNLHTDSNEWFEKFKLSYEAAKQSMAASKALFEYYSKFEKTNVEEVSRPEDLDRPVTEIKIPSTTEIPAPVSLPVVTESKKKFDFPHASVEIRSQPARNIPLLDVDNTLVMGTDNYNDELINALIEQGLTQVYLYTSYSSHGAANKDNKGSRDKLIKYLATKNIQVLGVIVEDDVLYQRGLGQWYKDKLQPLEIAAASNTLQASAQKQVADLEMELRMGISIAQYEQLSAEDKKAAEQRARVNSPDKGDMFKYVVSQLGSQHNYIFIDDDFTKNIPQVRKSANELSTKLITITVTQQKNKQQFLEEMKEHMIREYEKYSSDHERSQFFEKMSELFPHNAPNIAFRDLMIWATNRKELYQLIERQNYQEFNNKLSDWQLSEEGKLQIVEIMFEAIKNNNLNGRIVKDYSLQKNMAIPVVNFTLDSMLPSHYDILKKYKTAVLDNYPNNRYRTFELPANHFAKKFLEDNVDKYVGITHDDLDESIKNLKEFLELIHQSELTPSQRLQICEMLFTFIKENNLRDIQGKEIIDSSGKLKTIYNYSPGEKLPLLADFLSEHRKPLLEKQIELIKLLKGAYVDIVQDAQDKLISEDERAVVKRMLQNKNGLVDFQNSNTPVDISVTGTRKKLKQIVSPLPQFTEGDRLLKEEIAEYQLDDLNKIVDKILEAQDRNDNLKLKQYVEEYLGRRKYGILTRNYREEFIKVAIENGNVEFLNTNNNKVESSNPLLRLANNADPELKKAIIASEILDSHFWKGHSSSKKFVSEVLHKGRPTLEDFRRFRDTFANKKEVELKTIQERNVLLVTAISLIKSDAIREFLLQQIGHMQIEFFESNEFNEFLTKFFTPMVNALNQKYKENSHFPENYSDFYHVFDRSVSISAEKNKLLTKKFIENFNQAMDQHYKLNQLERFVHVFDEMTFVSIQSQMEELRSNILETYNSVKGHARSENPTDKAIYNSGSTELNGYHRVYEHLEAVLNQYKQKLQEINTLLDHLNLTSMQREQYKDFLDANNGVKAKLALIAQHSQQLKDVKKECLDPLQMLYSPKEKTSLKTLIKPITHFPKSSH